MIDPEDANYKCTLTPQSLQKAAIELFEDPKQRLGAVQALRRWIKGQSHLKSRTDTDFLLQVLRTAKFSQLRAREIIEKMLTMKGQFPKIMANYDSRDPSVMAYLEKGVIVELPKPDPEGRYYFIIRPGQMDLSDERFSVDNELRVSLALSLIRKENNENLIVNGEYIVYDMTGFSAKHVARMTTESYKNGQKIYQDCLLGRMKGFHIYNGGTFFEVVLSLSRPFMKKKYLDRIKVHSTMESLYQAIPMDLWPDEYLPDDYTGPSAGSIKTLTENTKQKCLNPAIRSQLMEYTSDKYKIDLEAKPVDTPQASFRKLNVD